MPERQPLHVNEPPRGLIGLDWRELWAYRDLARSLALRGLQVRYKQTLLGGLWALLQPLTMMIVFTVVFGRFLGVPSDGVPYPLFAYAGLIGWTLLATTVGGAAGSLVDNRPFLTKVYFPRLLIPVSVVGYALLDTCVASLLLVGLLGYYGVVPGPAALLLPFVLLGILACALGIGVLLAALTVKYRDVKFTIPYLIQVWLFATPVIYPLSQIPERFRAFAALNPMTGLVEAFRSCLFGTPLDARALGISCAVAAVVLVAGLVYFRQVEAHFADIV